MSDAEEVVVETFSEPGSAARRLGVSPSGLRRLSDAYEGVHGELPRKDGTKARLYPEEALESLRQARQLVEGGRYKSVVEALTALKRGLDVEIGTEMTGTPNGTTQELTGEALGVLVAELRSMRTELERLRVVVEERDRAQLPSDILRPAAEHGLIVRAALWLEKRIYGRGKAD